MLCIIFAPVTDLISLLILFLFFFLLGTTVFKKAEGSVASNRIGMKFGRIVLQVNTHRLTESDSRFDVTVSRWHFTQKSVAIWWVNTKHLPGALCLCSSIPPVRDL